MGDVPDDYELDCERFGGGQALLPTWRELRTIVEARAVEGWRFEVFSPYGNDEYVAGWMFGLLRASRLLVQAEPGGVYVYVHEEDAELHFDGPTEFVVWLEANEPRFEGFTPLQSELAADLLQSRMQEWSDGGN